MSDEWDVWDITGTKMIPEPDAPVDIDLDNFGIDLESVEEMLMKSVAKTITTVMRDAPPKIYFSGTVDGDDSVSIRLLLPFGRGTDPAVWRVPLADVIALWIKEAEDENEDEDDPELERFAKLSTALREQADVIDAAAARHSKK